MKTSILAAAFVLGTVTSGICRPAVEPGPSDLETLIWTKGETSRPDAQGRMLTTTELGDRLTIVTFASVGCTILCVTRTMDLDRLARDLPTALRDRVTVLILDTDPAADDPARLRAFADGLLGPGTRLRFLPTDAEETTALAARLRYPADRLPEPPPTLLLFDRRGNLAMTYGGDSLDAPRLRRDLTALDTFTRGLEQPPAPGTR